jgi:hypothetical protein
LDHEKCASKRDIPGNPNLSPPGGVGRDDALMPGTGQPPGSTRMDMRAVKLYVKSDEYPSPSCQFDCTVELAGGGKKLVALAMND